MRVNLLEVFTELNYLETQKSTYSKIEILAACKIILKHPKGHCQLDKYYFYIPKTIP